jgi:hypothetical protein
MKRGVPGCRVESIIFFACHSSGFISRILPCLYAETSCFACSRPAEDVRSVLYAQLASSSSFSKSFQCIHYQHPQAPSTIQRPQVPSTIQIPSIVNHPDSHPSAIQSSPSQWKQGHSISLHKEEHKRHKHLLHTNNSITHFSHLGSEISAECLTRPQ